MKRLLSVLLAVLMLSSMLAACGSQTSKETSDTVKLAVACPVTGEMCIRDSGRPGRPSRLWSGRS